MNSKRAKDAYTARRSNIADLLRDIKKGLAQHAVDFKSSGQADWGYAGDLGHYEELLRDVADSLMKRGEYDPENVA